MIITEKALISRIHHIPGSGLTYINNAKAGCSSIKKTLWLWKSPGNFTAPHDRAKAPFCKTMHQLYANIESVSNSKCFTVVRNPFTRTLSAYLDKINRNPRDNAVWIPFSKRFRLKGNTPSFSEFIKLISNEEPELLDQHFQPQYTTVFYPVIPYDFVGRLEAPEELRAFFKDYKIGSEEHRPHATSANETVLKSYSDKDVERVVKLFANDFEYFGYSTDPTNTQPIREPKLLKKEKLNLRRMIAGYTGQTLAQRMSRWLELAEDAPIVDVRYNLLDSSTMKPADFAQLTQEAIKGKITNWKFLSRIAEELLRKDFLDDARSVLKIAEKNTADI